MECVFAGVFGRDAGVVASSVGVALGDGSSSVVSRHLSLVSPSPHPVEGRTVLLSGRLGNSHELAAELGEPATEHSRLVALAFDRWGLAALSRLRGSFALLVWDGEAASGLLAVDQLGAGGLFLHESAGRLSFATEVRDLLRILARRPAPSSAGVVQWIADGQLSRGETLYEGVRRLEGGQLVRLEGGHARTEPYWTPRYVAPARIGVDEAAAELRSALTRSVRASVAGDGPVGVQVSGGLDSSIIAALACELDPPAPSLTAYSLVHPDHPEIDETRLIDRVTSSLGLRSERLEMRGASALTAALEYQLEWELPTTTSMLAFNMPLLRRAANDGIAVVVDGEGGDELLGCSEYVVADRLRRGDVRGAISLARRLPGAGDDPGARFLWALVREYGLKGAAPHALHRWLRRAPGAKRYAPSWLRPQAARTYVELRDEWSWKERGGPRSWSYHADLLTAGRERLGAFDLLRTRAALAGVTNTHPLLDDLDLVELALRLPPELTLDPTLTRPLSRAAVAGLLPDEIRLRPDKVDFSGLLLDALGGPDRALTARLLGAADAELWAYVERGAVGTLLATPLERRSTEWARVVARLATTESWLRSQADPQFTRRLLESSSPA